jgi:hypothetical protein
MSSHRQRIVRISGGHSSPFSGAAIVHREIATRLPRLLPAEFVVEDHPLAASLISRLRGSARMRSADVLLTTSTPLPVRTNAELVLPIIFDVRWLWTRGLAARCYRRADLARTARRAEHVFTISHTVDDQLRALRRIPDGGSSVLPLGPGQFQGIEAPPVGEREPSVVLVGAAPHKRNELAADLLGKIPGVVRDHRVVGVSVSAETKSILRRSFRREQLEFHENMSVEQLAEVLAAARTYLALGDSEGFGFAYLEAAHQGCDVVAVEQSITIEVLGDDAQLVDRLPPVDQLASALESTDTARVQRLQDRALGYDWDQTAAQIATHICGRGS